MGQASITEIAAEIENWDLLQKLPKQIGDFILCPGSGIKGQILNIAAYINEKTHCRLDLTYTSETFDYVPVKTVGLHTFRDERYFARDREHFAKMLLQHLDDIIKSKYINLIMRQKPCILSSGIIGVVCHSCWKAMNYLLRRKIRWLILTVLSSF